MVVVVSVWEALLKRRTLQNGRRRWLLDPLPQQSAHNCPKEEAAETVWRQLSAGIHTRLKANPTRQTDGSLKDKLTELITKVQLEGKRLFRGR